MQHMGHSTVKPGSHGLKTFDQIILQLPGLRGAFTVPVGGGWRLLSRNGETEASTIMGFHRDIFTYT